MEAQALIVWPGPVVVQRHIIPQLWSLQLPLQCTLILIAGWEDLLHAALIHHKSSLEPAYPTLPYPTLQGLV